LITQLELWMPGEAYFSGCPLAGSCLCAALGRRWCTAKLIITVIIGSVHSRDNQHDSYEQQVSRSTERGRSTSIRQGFRGGCVSCEGDTPDRVDR